MTRRDYIAIGITILLVCSVVFVEHRPIVYPMTITEQKEYNATWGIDDYRDGFACPICKSDSVDTLKYGLGVGACGIGRETKQYRCRQCDYEWGLLPEFKKNRGRAFNELTLSDDGFYVVDVDFDGENDIVMINDGKARVYRYDSTIWRSKNVSKQVPYCFLAAHLCCDAHKAFTTFNYSTKTIYIETHYGSGDINTSIRQFQKIGEEWKEVIPVTPSYIINKELYPRNLCPNIPTATQMGKVYKRLILNTIQPGEDYADAILRVYNNPVCEVIDNYNTSAYYEPSPYIARSYYAGGFV